MFCFQLTGSGFYITLQPYNCLTNILLNYIKLLYLSTGYTMANLLQVWHSLDARFVPLVHVLCQWLRDVEISKPQTGFSSTMITLLTVSFLQTRSPPVLPNVVDYGKCRFTPLL
jgi:hypothetical protein